VTVVGKRSTKTVWVFVTFLIGFLMAIASTLDAGIVTKTVGLTPFDPEGTPEGISKGEWLKASGGMKVTYYPDGTALFMLKASGLVPNAVYTVWEIYSLEPKKDRPLGGGKNNVFLTGSNGKGFIVIKVDHFPQGKMAIDYHADEATHGITAGVGGKTVFGHMIGEFPDEWEMAKKVQR
jgi:hypothetical protein